MASNTFLSASHLIKAGLREDGWPWDWTSSGSVRDPLKKIQARIVAKAPGVWAGAALTRSLNWVAKELAEESGGQFQARSLIDEGSPVKRGEIVAEWRGSTGILLALERPFLNLAQYASGIATATRELVSIVKRACPKDPPRVTPTRKTLPLYRDLALCALQAGGGYAHRISLSGGVLIKENHIAAAGGIGKAIQGARAVAPHGLKIEIEVRNLAEMQEALAGQAEVILLDNFSVAEVKRAVKSIDAIFPPGSGSRPLIEVSGGLTAANIGKYAVRGVDVLSVGSLTHSVRALDLSLLVGMK